MQISLLVKKKIFCFDNNSSSFCEKDLIKTSIWWRFKIESFFIKENQKMITTSSTPVADYSLENSIDENIKVLVRVTP